MFSIGGDIYTLNPEKHFSKALPVFCEKCKKAGLKYILFGASVGPFDKNKKAEMYFKKHLQIVDLIVAREYHTINYLESIGISRNVVFAPDPAFFVSSEVVKLNSSSTQKTIGLNFSPLSSLYFYSDLTIAKEKLSMIIQQLLEHTGYRIILIPHVFSNFVFDDDLRFLKGIFELLPEVLKSKIEIIENDKGFVFIKNEIIKCDIMIAARMHCAVNAIAAKVPTVLLSYSEKAIGMANLVYGNSDNVISLDVLKNIELDDLIKSAPQNSRIDALKQFDFDAVWNENVQ